MVERLKVAVAKARANRARVSAGATPSPAQDESGRSAVDAEPAPATALEATHQDSTVARGEKTAAPASVDAAWQAMEVAELDLKHLERNRIITYARNDPAHAAFDVLRTRILRVFQKHGWSRLGITSPSKSCGKTFVASNLALSMARHADCRTILMDMDLRMPTVSEVLGVAQPDPIDWFLSGDVEPEQYLRRAESNLALGLNSKKILNPAETLLSPQASDALKCMHDKLVPNIVIYDLPPMLAADDVLGFLPQLDCVLLVVGGGITRPDEITECERLLVDQTHLLGVLLNKAEDAKSSRYGYSAA